MKKLIGIVLYIVFIIFLFNIDIFGTVEDVTYYSDVKAEDLQNIEIDGSNVEVDIIASPFDEIAITRTTSKKKSDEISYSTNYIDNTLIIKQFKKEESDNTLKDKLYIQIPQEAVLKNLNVQVNGGKISFDGVVCSEATLKTNNDMDLLIENSKFNNLSINALNVDSSLKNTVVSNSLLYTIKGGSISNVNVTGVEEEIESVSSLSYYNESSFFDTTNFLGDNVQISFVLSPNKNYYFTSVKNKLTENFLEENNTDYKYNKDKNTVKKYTINTNNNKIVSIEENTNKGEE